MFMMQNSIRKGSCYTKKLTMFEILVDFADAFPDSRVANSKYPSLRNKYVNINTYTSKNRASIIINNND